MNTRDAIQHALAFAYEGVTQTASYLTYLCPIDRSAGSQGVQIARAVQSAKIRAAISAQEPHIEAWLLYCYGPDVEAFRKQDKHAHIASTVAQEAFKGPNGHKKHKRLQEIAYIAVDDYRVGLLMGRELPVSTYLEATGVPAANWARDFEKHRREALMVLKRYDSIGIGNVSIVVKNINDSECQRTAIA